MPNSASTRIIAVLFLCLLSGCAARGTPGAVSANPADPNEKFNRKMDRFNDSLDRHILKPASDAYVKVTPQAVRDALGNAFNNLTYFETILNEFLQGKVDPGSKDVVRWGFNSTVGLGGLFDVATPLGLPRHNQDFGLTLAVWGVKQGDYLVLPFVGPTTGRDVWALPVAVVTDPLTWVGDWWQTLPVDAVRVLDFRASAQSAVHFRDTAALDSYVFTRQAYLQYREYQLHGANPPTTQPAMDYFEDEPSAPPLRRSNTPASGSPGNPGTPASSPTRQSQSRPAIQP